MMSPFNMIVGVALTQRLEMAAAFVIGIAVDEAVRWWRRR